MATRSIISISNSDGTVTGIYCHWDGYPSHNGRILHEYYRDEEKIRQLIALGNLSSLGPHIGEEHDFDDRDHTVCTFYGRDRKDGGEEAVCLGSLHELIEQLGQEFNYHYQDGEWFINVFGSTRFELLSKVIEQLPPSTIAV